MCHYINIDTMVSSKNRTNHSVYSNIVPHKALTSVLISKSLAELAAEDPKLDGALLSKEHTLYLSFLGPNNPPLSSPKFGSCL